jgi:digeranylgeranylglycerophospholipid reductase
MITIIGAGPAGCFSAYLLAKAGKKVQVFENGSIIGQPVACTGVVTLGIMAKRLKLPKKLIVNDIDRARIISPNRKTVSVRLKSDVIIDRAGLDRYLASMAKKAGAKFYVNHRFESVSRSNGKLIVSVKDKTKGDVKKFETDYLVGADGPISSVAKAVGLFGKRQFYVGQQVTMKIKNDNVIDFYPSEEGIAWVVPENNGVARVGIAAVNEPHAYFRKFLETVGGKDYEKKIIGRQAGPIPLYNPRLKSVSKSGRVLLVGDAAGTVKAPTLGGINQSLIGAEAVAESIITGKNYEKLWKKKMGMDLYLSLLMRKAMKGFSNKDYNKLVETFSKDKNRKILESYDRDVPSKFALKLAIREPKLLLLARKAWL